MKTSVMVSVMLWVLLTSTVAYGTSSYPPPPNVRITTIPQLNNEEQVWICPTDSNVIIANWRDFRLGYRQVGIGRSVDGGQTWTDSLVAWWLQYFDGDSQQSDPTLTIDAEGNFYMSNLDWDAFGFTGLSTIAFYKSTDQGVSWTGPVAGVWSGDPDIFEDKQFITVDRTGGPHHGNLYCSWTRFPNPDRIVLVRSTDGASSFEDTVIVGPAQTSTGCGSYVVDAGQFSIPMVNSNGDVHVFWQGYALDSGLDCTGRTVIKHAVSTDGGVTFTWEDTVISVSGYTEADGGINTYSQPVVDADITGGPFDGSIYLTFTNIGPEDADNSDVDFMRSDDNAVNWSDRLTVNDDANSGAIDNFHPWLIVNQEGVIVVVFYDQRLDPPGYYLFDLFAAYSFDGGRSFTTNHRISTVSSSPDDLKSTSFWKPPVAGNASSSQPLVNFRPRAGKIGEYIGVTAFHDKVNAVWTDTRDGNSEIYTANWYLPILEPRLLYPSSGSFVGGSGTLGWATAWKHDQDRYRVEISDDEFFVDKVLVRVVDTNFYALDTPLSDGLLHWRVKAFNTSETDSSEYSPTWFFELDTTVPAAPELLSPAYDSVLSDPTPWFDWTDSDKAAPVTYTLYLSVDSLFPPGPNTVVFGGLMQSDFEVTQELSEGTPTFWKVMAADDADNSATSAVSIVTYLDFTCGDVNFDGAGPNIVDLTYLVAHLFGGGPPPPVPEAANVDGTDGINIVDLSHLVAYLFASGPEPVCDGGPN